MNHQSQQEDEDWELQQAIALSMQGTDDAEKTQHVGTNANPQNKQTPSSSKPQQQKRQKNTKKLPVFDPTPEEIASIFSEIDSSNKRRITAQDIQETARKLGLDIDDEQALAMIEYAIEHGLKQSSHPSALSFDDFTCISDHFRVTK